MNCVRREPDDPRDLARAVAMVTGESPRWIFHRGFGLLAPEREEPCETLTDATVNHDQADKTGRDR